MAGTDGTPIDPVLARLIAAWPTLPEATMAAIQRLIETAAGEAVPPAMFRKE